MPLGNGPATLTASVGDRTATAAISVEDFDLDPSWCFRNHVEAVLTRHGCNARTCHSAAADKNGLRLRLRDYVPELDHDVLTRHALGQRIVPAATAESLLLLKPTKALPHGVGVMFLPDSPDYLVIAVWIAAGTPRRRGPGCVPRRIRLRAAGTPRASPPVKAGKILWVSCSVA